MRGGVGLFMKEILLLVVAACFNVLQKGSVHEDGQEPFCLLKLRYDDGVFTASVSPMRAALF